MEFFLFAQKFSSKVVARRIGRRSSEHEIEENLFVLRGRSWAYLNFLEIILSGLLSLEILLSSLHFKVKSKNSPLSLIHRHRSSMHSNDTKERKKKVYQRAERRELNIKTYA